jgi:hypothetical protein
MTWTNGLNEDGLQVKFGTDRSEVINQGVTSGEEKVFVYKVTGTDVADTDTAVPDGDAPFIPAGAFIKDAVFTVQTAFVGATAVLDLGTKNAAGTNISDAGIDSLAIGVIDADNDAVVSDGALIGTVVAVDSYVMATYDTAAFTAGEGTLVIKYIEA